MLWIILKRERILTDVACSSKSHCLRAERWAPREIPKLSYPGSRSHIPAPKIRLNNPSRCAR
ncbi:ubiquitin-activating enzyme [Histoplasma capsulatum G186AR]|nr:ubiquitin-activating enzyme [Histoplasma capsulatum G186AR]